MVFIFKDIVENGDNFDKYDQFQREHLKTFVSRDTQSMEKRRKSIQI